MHIRKPTTREHVIHYLIHYIKLGTYDNKFIRNIYNHNDKPLTTNQNELLEKIILRYSKQLAKKELNASDLIKLPWTKPPVESSPEFTNARITRNNDKLIIRTPYKKDYVNKLKTIAHPTKWEHEKKLWITDYCEYTLKFVTKVTEEHFNVVEYCKDIQQTIKYLSEYENCKYWDPTLIYTNDRYMLYATNEIVYEHVKDLLVDIDLKVLARLVRHGIVIDDSVTVNLAKTYPIIDIQFVVDVQPRFEYTDDLNEFIGRLEKVGCDLLIMSDLYYYKKLFSKSIIALLKEKNINVHVLERGLVYGGIDISAYKFPVVLSMSIRDDKIITNSIGKIVHLISSI
jgi:hypothetical protein